MLFNNLLVAALAGVGAAEIFSFAEWVEGVIQNPDGDNLTPDEAIAAWEISVNSTEGGLEKRTGCNHLVGMECSVVNAVWCVDYLARIGAQGTSCSVCGTVQMCVHGDAQIRGVTGGGVSCTSSNCNDVARAGGYILDKCTRADGMIQGYSYAHGNGHMAVHIAKRD